MKKTWTKETAERVLKSGVEGLQYCSAYDFYKKSFGMEALEKLLAKAEPSKKKVIANDDTEYIPTKPVETTEESKPSQVQAEKKQQNNKFNGKKERRNNTSPLTTSIGSLFADILK